MKGAWERYWFDERPLERVALFRFFVLAAALYTVVLHQDAVLQAIDGVDLSHLNRTWRPIWILQALSLPTPNGLVARIELVVIYAALASAIAGFWTRTSCAIAAALTLHWVALAYSFGKPHHGFVGTAFALAALPIAPIGARWSVDAWLSTRRSASAALPERGAYAAFPLRVAQVSMAIGYFFAGASKIAIGGLQWMNGYSLQAVLLSTSADWSEAAARSVAMCRAMSITTVVVQMLFPLTLFLPIARWFFVPAAIAFHLVSGKTMGTGWFLTLWFTLAAFVPLERVVRREFWTGTPWRVVRGIALAAAAVAVGLMYFELVPIAWLALAPVPWLAERAATKRARLVPAALAP